MESPDHKYQDNIIGLEVRTQAYKQAKTDDPIVQTGRDNANDFNPLADQPPNI